MPSASFKHHDPIYWRHNRVIQRRAMGVCGARELGMPTLGCYCLSDGRLGARQDHSASDGAHSHRQQKHWHKHTDI